MPMLLTVLPLILAGEAHASTARISILPPIVPPLVLGGETNYQLSENGPRVSLQGLFSMPTTGPATVVVAAWGDFLRSDPNDEWRVSPILGGALYTPVTAGTSIAPYARAILGAGASKSFGSLFLTLSPTVAVAADGLFAFDSLLSGPPLLGIGARLPGNTYIAVRSSFVPLELGMWF